MPYYQDATPYKGNIPLTRIYVAQFIESSSSSSGAAAELSWPEGTQENDRVPVYPMITWAEKMQQSEKKKILLIFKEYLEKNISVLRNCAEKPKNIFRNFYQEVRLLRTIKFF